MNDTQSIVLNCVLSAKTPFRFDLNIDIRTQGVFQWDGCNKIWSAIDRTIFYLVFDEGFR